MKNNPSHARRMVLPSEMQAFHREERRRDREAVNAFVSAAQAGDAERFAKALQAIDERCSQRLWRASMKAIADASCAEEFRRGFLNLYISSGDHIRQEVGDDLILISALRSLLPGYTGPAMILYRGEEGASNRRRRTYGLAWTSSKEVARDHACGLWQSTKGGSVLLQAFAPTAAIVCAPGLIEDRYGEQEYVVDRRRLTKIRVIERFSQVRP